MLDFPALFTTGWFSNGTEVKLILLPCWPAMSTAAPASIPSTWVFNAIIFALAWSTVNLPACNSVTITADSFAAFATRFVIVGNKAWYDADSSLVINPVLATSCFNILISASDCIASAPVIACHLAASSATIPVEAPPIDVRPWIFGRSPDIYIWGLFPIFWLTFGAPGTTPKIVCADFWSVVIPATGFICDIDLVSCALNNGWFGLTCLPPGTTIVPAIVANAGATDICPAVAFCWRIVNSAINPSIAVFNTVAAFASL